jgi:polyisoprenoid-binding protein YceI
VTIDSACSSVGFLIRHMGVATVRGTFSSFDADFDDEPAGLRLHGEVEVASVDTGQPIRDDRLRDEFFNAPEFPVITFDGHASAESGVSGFLTIRGVTRPLTMELTAEPLGDGAVHLHAEGRIRRSDFDLDWEALRQAGQRLVADQVRLFADVVLRPGPATG